jgi:complex iron-sulfur molybdoenzyme family reductase subunit alpha
MFSGAVVAFGENNVGCTYDFMFNTNVSIMWGANPSVTRMSDAHFIWEGKYNGSKIIVITPEYNATAKSADLWIPIKVGSDNFLAMSIISVILEEKLYKPEFMKIFTDLPFLVNTKTKKLIRRSDIEGLGDCSFDEEFYCMNKKTGKIALMPGTKGSKDKTLKLKDLGIEPELEGSWNIKLHNKEEIEVTTVFQFLKRSAVSFTPEKMKSKTGVAPSVVRQLAKDIAIPKVVMITTGASLNKYFNGIISIWNISSIAGLTGRMGASGGINTRNKSLLLESEVLTSFNGKYSPRLASSSVEEFLLSDGMETFKDYYNDDDLQRSQKMDKEEYIKEVELLLKDKPSFVPEVSILVGGKQYKDAFLEKMNYLCVIDFKMSKSAVWADLILPASSYYEVWDIKSNSNSHRFTNLAQPVPNLKPIGKTMDEWSIFALIAKKLENIANKPENIVKNKIPDDKKFAREGYRDLGNFFKEFTNTDKASQENNEPILGKDPIGKKTGDRLALEATLANYKQYDVKKIDKPLNSFEDNLVEFKTMKTLSGRQTFYVDHPIWIKMGVNINTGIDGIKPKRAAFPYSMITPHGRYSIGSNYRTSQILLRLQRGKPFVIINPVVADLKGIKDADEAKIFNALGDFLVMIKISKSAPLDSIIIEHGWEAYMFKNLKGHNEVVSTSLNLLEMTNDLNGSYNIYDYTVNLEKA